MIYISSDTNVWIDFKTCLKRLQANNGKGIRLPEEEIISRLQQIIGI